MPNDEELQHTCEWSGCTEISPQHAFCIKHRDGGGNRELAPVPEKTYEIVLKLANPFIPPMIIRDFVGYISTLNIANRYMDSGNYASAEVYEVVKTLLKTLPD